MLDLAATVPGLKGIELVGNWHINDENMESMKKAVKNRGLEICMLTPDLWTQAKWGRGSMAAELVVPSRGKVGGGVGGAGGAAV